MYQLESYQIQEGRKCWIRQLWKNIFQTLATSWPNFAKRANLVELEKSYKISLWPQKSASLKPGTELPKLGLAVHRYTDTGTAFRIPYTKLRPSADLNLGLLIRRLFNRILRAYPAPELVAGVVDLRQRAEVAQKRDEPMHQNIFRQTSVHFILLLPRKMYSSQWPTECRNK